MDLTHSLRSVRNRMEIDEFQAEMLELNRAGTRAELNALRQAIRDGDSTGDRWLDYVIVRHGDATDAKADFYRAIETQVAAHVSQPLLIVSRFTTQEGCTGFGGKGYTVFHELFHLGVLNDAQMIIELEHMYLGLPMAKYVTLLDPYGMLRETVTKHDGPWYEDWNLSIDKLDQPIERKADPFLAMIRFRFESEDLPFAYLELAFGTDEIRKWFSSRAEIYRGNIQATLYQALDYDPDNPPLALG